MNEVNIGGTSMRFFVALLLRMTSFNCYKVLRRNMSAFIL